MMEKYQIKTARAKAPKVNSNYATVPVELIRGSPRVPNEERGTK